jgi:hypothetical protein
MTTISVSLKLQKWHLYYRKLLELNNWDNVFKTLGLMPGT